MSLSGASRAALALALVAGASRWPVVAEPLLRGRSVTVVFRLDDYSSRSPTDLETRLIDAFRRHHVPLTVGVVPFIVSRSVYDPSPQEPSSFSAAKIAVLKEAVEDGTVEVALHGTSHQTARGASVGRFVRAYWPYDTEFRGVRRDVQAEKIARGRTFLEEAFHTRVDTFIPPWNSYDRNLLRCLETQGFRSLSAGRWGPLDVSSPLKWLPATSNLSGVRNAVRAARIGKDPEPLIVVLIHPSDFRRPGRVDGGPDTRGLEEVLAWISSQRDVRTLSIRQAAERVSDLSARRFFWNRTAFLWEITPRFMERLFPRAERSLYLSPPAARAIKVRLSLLLSLSGFGTLALSAALASRAGTALFSRFRALLVVSALGAPLLGGLVLLALLPQRALRAEGALASALLAGGCAGIWRSAFRLLVGERRPAAAVRGRVLREGEGGRAPPRIREPRTPQATGSEARRSTGEWSPPESSGRRPS